MAQITNAQIYDELSKLTQTINALDTLAMRVEEHDHFINGNGKPGQKVTNNQFDERLKTLANNIERLEKAVKGMQDLIKKFTIGIVTAGVAWFLFTVLPDMIKLIP